MVIIIATITATAAYVSEGTGIGCSQVEEELFANLPSTVSNAVKQSVIKMSRLTALLMKE